jgi:F-type H+-transporting ATPase subunit a
MSLKPKWWQHILEAGVQAFVDLISRVTRQQGERFLTFLGTLFIFIATANLLGIFPALVSPTSDINTPLALALVVFFAVHYYGVREFGVKGYIKRLAEPSPVILPMQLLGHLSRTVSLTLRLFGNILAGGVIIAVLYLVVPLILPIPLLLFNMLIGILQAFVFTILSAVYIGAAVKGERTEVRR